MRRGLAAITAFVAMITGCGSQSGPVPAASSSPTPDTYGTLACTTLLDGGEHSLLGEAWRVISRRAEWDDADWVAWGEVVVDVLTVTASRATSPKLAEHAQVTLDGLHAGRYGDLITVGDGIAFNPGTLFTRMVELGLWCVGEGLTPLETYTEAITPPSGV